MPPRPVPAMSPPPVSAPSRGGEDPAALAAELRLSITRLARRLRQEADVGLSPSMLSALAMVHVHGPLTLGALATLEAVAPPTVTKVVNRLEEQHLVVRVVDENDRRITRVVTTPEGEALLDASRDRKNAWLADQLSSLGARDLARLAAAARVLEGLVSKEAR